MKSFGDSSKSVMYTNLEIKIDMDRAINVKLEERNPNKYISGEAWPAWPI